tara:strand:- start:3155 stop:3658 length:504 start_codon:yes stop_codon:yes gene_type:complete
MDDSLNICLACGLCCDGTLIGFVELEHEEIPRLKQIMEIEEEDANGFFLHPCNKYCDGCTIYADRPKNCDKFKCQLLNAVNAKELEFKTAVDVIQLVKQKKTDIEEKVSLLPFALKSPSFYFKMVELKKRLQTLKSDGVITKNQRELITDLAELDQILIQHFGVSLN